MSPDMLPSMVVLVIAPAVTWAILSGLPIPKSVVEAELRAMQDRSHFATDAPRVPPHEGHEIVPVETGGEVVARLCVTCDEQLEP